MSWTLRRRIDPIVDQRHSDGMLAMVAGTPTWLASFVAGASEMLSERCRRQRDNRTDAILQ